MLARLPDLEPVLADPSQEGALAAPEAAAPEVADAPAAELSSEGAIPEVAANGEIVEPGKTASEQAFGDKPTAQSGQIDGGLYSPEEYQAACQAAGTPDKWDDKYAHGHTSASQWTQPYEGRYDMTFTLQRGHSASQALKDFLAGPTIADWRTLAVAVEMDEIRDALGDQKFDRLFGSTVPGDDVRVAQRLQISLAMYTTPFAAQMEALAAEHDEAETRTEEPAAPQVAAQVEDKPLQGGVTAQPAPELVADELGLEREQELA